MEEGCDIEVVKYFMDIGENIYNENFEIMFEVEEFYVGMCLGCYGYYVEGKIGFGLNDSYWIYFSNEDDVGLFLMFYGGVIGQMGLMWGSLILDEMLMIMVWVWYFYIGDFKDVVWLIDEQKVMFKFFQFKGLGDDD